MNLNTNEILSQSMSSLTYNVENIAIPKEDQSNLYFGIGLWSVKDGLSEGLPVDVMQMLLPATIKRSQIIEAHPGQSSKIIILIADSMAIREGAEEEKVHQLVEIYKTSLMPLLDFLQIKECSEIILSSELESLDPFKEALESVENAPAVKQLKEGDTVHYAYIRTQTAITRYMNTHGHVGVKIGWICTKSCSHLKDRKLALSSAQWDELKFDHWHEEIFNDSTMQYLYAKAGLKHSTSSSSKRIRVVEGCPYTAYKDDRRYIVQIQGKKEIKDVCPLQKKVTDLWQIMHKVFLVLGLSLPQNSTDISTLLNYLTNLSTLELEVNQHA